MHCAQLIRIGIIFVLVLADVFNERNKVHSEREKTAEEIVGQYIRWDYGGVAVDSPFFTVTEQERIEADNLMADTFPIGDPQRPLPDNEEKIESALCRNHRANCDKILEYVRKQYPLNLITPISIHTFAEQIDEYCADTDARNIYITNASVINTRISGELNSARNKFIDNLSAVFAEGKHNFANLSILCCSIWNYKTELLCAAPDKYTKYFLKNYFDGFTGDTIKYLCTDHYEGSKECKTLVIPGIAPSSTTVARFTSVGSALVEVTSLITSLILD